MFERSVNVTSQQRAWQPQRQPGDNSEFRLCTAHASKPQPRKSLIMFSVNVHWVTFFTTSVLKSPATCRHIYALLQHNLSAKTAVQICFTASVPEVPDHVLPLPRDSRTARRILRVTLQSLSPGSPSCSAQQRPRTSSCNEMLFCFGHQDLPVTARFSCGDHRKVLHHKLQRPSPGSPSSCSNGIGRAILSAGVQT